MVFSSLPLAGRNKFLNLGHALVHVFHGSPKVLPQFVNLMAEQLQSFLIRFRKRLQGPEAVVKEL